VANFAAQQTKLLSFRMKFRLLFAALFAACSLRAAVPPPAQLFPQDTLALVSVPDWTVARATAEAGNYGQLWADPVMKPFRDKFEAAFKEQVLGDLEKELGVKVADYLPLLQGQLSLGLVQNGWNPKDPKTEPAAVLVLDARNKGGELKTRLAEARQKLIEAKNPLKVVKIRDAEFSTLVIDRKAMRVKAKAKAKAKAGPDDKDKDDDDDDDDAKTAKEAKPIEITFGQVDSVLLISDSAAALEKFVARLTGGTVPAVAEAGEYQSAAKTAAFADSYAFGWVNLAALYSVIEAGADQMKPQANALGVDPRKALLALGLDGLKSLAFSSQKTADGYAGVFAVGVPEAKRTGLAKLLAFEAKDAAPPAFVPADVVKFQRWRLNGQQTWATLESLLQTLSPQLGGFMQMTLGALGKDKDPNFDFKKNFIASLGDDFVSYERAPTGNSAIELANPPGLTLLGSANPDQLVAGLKAAAALLPTGGEEPKEREFNGKKIIGVKWATPADPKRVIEIASSGGFVALSSRPAVIEEFLRSAEGGGKALKDQAGLAEAAQRVGGMGTGLFGYQDMKEATRAAWETMRQSGGLDKLNPTADPKSAKQASQFFDVTLLPPFEQVAKYFGVSVYAGGWDVQGFALKVFSPTPK
jgi:hypothetical protein